MANMELMLRDSIERRIEAHMTGAYQSLIEVGCCLNEAKDAGVVAHGEWREWVHKHTGLGERQAQKLMQVARNVEPGSMLSRLPVTQIQMLLALPEDVREGVTEKAVEESMTVKQLRAEIERVKGEQADVVRKHEQSLAVKDRELKTLLKQQRTYVDAVDAAKRELAEKEQELRRVKDAAAKPSPALLQRIKELEGMVDEAEREAERQAELRQAAQEELINREMGGGDVGIGQSNAAEIAGELRMIIGTLGLVRQMSFSDDSRAELTRIVRAVAEGCEDALKALTREAVVVSW